MSIERNLFEVFRIIPVEVDKEELQKEESIENIIDSMTVNENIKTLGYSLDLDSIILLSKTKEETRLNLFDKIAKYCNIAKAKPMYPDYPKQVMSMDDFTLRLHQLIHYFSTYELGYNKGWLPKVNDTEKVLEDKSLLDLKFIKLITTDKVSSFVFKELLPKKERFTIKEQELIKCYVIDYLLQTDYESKTPVGFKENSMELFYTVLFLDLNINEKIKVLKTLCQHTGDVFKCTNYSLKRSKFKFRTTHKKTIVKLLESYDIEDFVNNIYPSNGKSNFIKVVLQYIDYNSFSRSNEHYMIVNKVRNNDYMSWYGLIEKTINMYKRLSSKNKNNTPPDNLLSAYATRPGLMFRAINRLVNLGIDQDDIFNALKPEAGSLSTESIVFALNDLCNRKVDANKNTISIMKKLLYEKLKSIKTPIYDKRIKLANDSIIPYYSTFERKNPNDTYIRSGMAFDIPDDCKYLRFFVYWNDKRCIDIDLHATVFYEDEFFKCGYDGKYKKEDFSFSGDITHSDAAEFIDIKVNSKIKYVSLNISSFSRVPFSKIDEVYVGVMAVNSINEEVKLYDPKNCIFYNELKSEDINIDYGIIGLDDCKYIKYTGMHSETTYATEQYMSKYSCNDFNIAEYLQLLFKAQNVKIVQKDSDLTVSLQQNNDSNNISMINENFFMDL